MVLLRVPGLREVLQMLYRIKMLERTLRLGEIRGPVTALLAVAIYVYMEIKKLQQWRKNIEKRQQVLEREMDLRFISIEEALGKYGRQPRRQHGDVPI